MFQKEVIRKYWSEETPLIYKNKPYSVHKMSYGEYLIAPRRGNWQTRGERDPFLTGTLALQETKTGFEIGHKIIPE